MWLSAKADFFGEVVARHEVYKSARNLAVLILICTVPAMAEAYKYEEYSADSETIPGIVSTYKTHIVFVNIKAREDGILRCGHVWADVAFREGSFPNVIGRYWTMLEDR